MDYEALQEAEWVARRKAIYRIEALRAASGIVAGIYSSVGIFNRPTKEFETLGGTANGTLQLAEQFAKWLETGER